MRDFLPNEVLRRRHVIDVIARVYEAHGFVPLETPSIEHLSTLLGKYGEEGDQLLYRLLHRRDALTRPLEQAVAQGRAALESELADQGLRYDLTVPLARVVAQYGELPRFFKRYQIQPVWRADRPGKGRFREFYQCDVDITGSSSLIAEAEVCSAVATVLHELGFDQFTVRLNHRELLRSMIRAAGIDEALEATALVAVDKLDKIGRDAVVAELEQRGITNAAGQALLDMITPSAPSATGSNTELLASLRSQVDERGQRALDDLAQLLELCAENPAGPHLQVSPDLARGLGYYTGPIFEIAVPDLAGSLGGGGRYDDLVGMFGKQQVPAVGFSLGLERILVVMAERDMFAAQQFGPDLMLCWLGVPPVAVMRVATQLRAAGLAVEVFPEQAKLGKQLQYADADGVKARFAGILGDEELAAGELTIKHLESGRQAKLPLAELDPARLAALASADE